MKIITWRLEKTQGNNKLLWKKCLPAIKRNKTFWSKQVIPRTNAGEVFIFFLQLLPLKVYETFLFRHSKIVGKIIWSVTFPQKRRSNKYRSWKPNLAFPNLILVWYTKVKFYLKNRNSKGWLCFRIILWRTKTKFSVIISMLLQKLRSTEPEIIEGNVKSFWKR